MNKDIISRSYTLTQIELAIREATGIDRVHLEQIRDFIKVLPCDEELDEQVYCGECEYLRVRGTKMTCRYKDKCFFIPEGSTPRRQRPCWTPKEMVNAIC